jgi:glycosyltransferase involved in cell wall biosynthesis
MVVYFAHFDVNRLIGVVNKIDQTVNALNSIGYNAKRELISVPGLKGHFALLRQLLKSKADIIILRNTLYSMVLLAPALLWKRIMGKLVIIDIPSPNAIVVHELLMQKSNLINKIIRLAILFLSFPWVLFPAHKILQYAKESAYFSFGLGCKTQLVANGIDVDSIPMRNSVPLWPAETFVMIAVASLAPWHGFDRVIRAMADYQNNPLSQRINLKFIIVGDGEVRQEWQVLAKELGVKDLIDFVGYQKGAALDDLFNHAHVAIASLGLYRIGLEVASVLKSREYAARGIPFVAAGKDIDFEPAPRFVFQITNDDNSLSINQLIDWFSMLGREVEVNQNIREFAEKNLSYKIKLLDIATFT